MGRLILDDGRDIPFATERSESSLAPLSRGDYYDTEIRVLMLGDAKVGKTGLKTKFAGEFLSGVYTPDTSAQLLTKLFKFNSDEQEKRVRLDIWDTPGVVEYRAIMRAYIEAATVIIIAFDLTSTESFNHVQQYLDTVNEHASESAKVVLVGTKSDREADIQVQVANIREFITNDAKKSSRHHIDAYIETSALDGKNIDYLFKTIATIAKGLPVVSLVASAPAPGVSALLKQLFCCGGGRKTRSGVAGEARGAEEEEAARREKQPLLRAKGK